MGERSDFCRRIIHVEYVIGQVVLSTLILSNSIHHCLLGHINHYKSSPTTNQNILCSVMLTVAVTQQYFTYTHNTLLIISFVCLFWGQCVIELKLVLAIKIDMKGVKESLLFIAGIISF